MGMLALCRENFGTAYMHPEKRHKAGFGLMWSRFFIFFRLLFFIIIIFIFFFVFHKPTTGSPGGIGVLPPYPQQCEGHASRIMWGMSQTMVWGASWNLGGWSENNKCLGL